MTVCIALPSPVLKSDAEKPIEAKTVGVDSGESLKSAESAHYGRGGGWGGHRGWSGYGGGWRGHYGGGHRHRHVVIWGK